MFNIIDFIGIVILVVGAFLAFRRGFVKTFFGFISTFLAIVLAFVFCNTGVEIIKNNTRIDELIYETITIALEEAKNKDENEIKEETTKDNSLLGILESMPENIQSSVGLEEYKENAKITIKTNVIEIILKILSWIIIYILARFILWAVCIVFDGIMNIPFLKQINNLTGLFLGIILGFFRIYVILAFISFLVPVVSMENFVTLIKESLIISVLYENNILVSLIF